VIVETRPTLAQVVRRPEVVRSPGERIPDVRRILVVRDDRLGDVVLTVPAVRALRRTYPTAWIGLLTQPSAAGIVDLTADIDEILVDRGRARDIEQAAAEFRPDATVCISRSLGAAWSAFRLHLPNRVGTGRRGYSWMFHRRVGDRRRSGTGHEVEYALSFAHRLGAEPGPAEFALAVPPGFDESCAHWLDLQGVRDPFVVLHPGSGGSCPAWPVSHQVQLAALLEGQGCSVVFSLGPQDGEVYRALDDEARSIRRLPRFRGSVAALGALLARAKVVVGSSTGPVHLAAALGTRTLAFHVPWKSCGVERWGPYSEHGWALVAELPEARHWSQRQKRRLGHRLLDGISPSVALECVEALVEERTPRTPDGSAST
jgi:ADP-heptose:LPS heptosyltransferase